MKQSSKIILLKPTKFLFQVLQLVKGRPLPENDIWIAALSLQHNLILVTRDAHFQQVVEEALEEWILLGLKLGHLTIEKGNKYNLP
jgi:predicted nuclease of predicted toxin-antitoxin system